jgi:hypothetical protein
MTHTYIRTLLVLDKGRFLGNAFFIASHNGRREAHRRRRRHHTRTHSRGMTEFSNLGVHCAAEGCALKDFLPFTCDACSKVFCLEHRVYETHACPVGHSAKDVRVFLCPICDKSVKIRLDEDINTTWARHADSECTTAKTQKSKDKVAKVRRRSRRQAAKSSKQKWSGEIRPPTAPCSFLRDCPGDCDSRRSHCLPPATCALRPHACTAPRSYAGALRGTQLLDQAAVNQHDQMSAVRVRPRKAERAPVRNRPRGGSGS